MPNYIPSSWFFFMLFWCCSLHLYLLYNWGFWRDPLFGRKFSTCSMVKFWMGNFENIFKFSIHFFFFEILFHQTLFLLFILYGKITILSYNLNGQQMLDYWIKNSIDIINHTYFIEFIFYSSFFFFVAFRWLG